MEQGWYLDLKEGAGNLVSAQTLQGRILVSSFVLYKLFSAGNCAYPTEVKIQSTFVARLNQRVWTTTPRGRVNQELKLS